jgi:hypothetical protein
MNVHLIDSFVILWSETTCNTDQVKIVRDVIHIITWSIILANCKFKTTLLVLDSVIWFRQFQVHC